MLEQVLARQPGHDLTEPQRACRTVWERLDAWPDAVAGLARLEERFVACALSNASLWRLIQPAKHGRLPWDAVLSVELFGAYKPDPRVSTGAVELLQLRPAEALMVAAQLYDLRATRANGLRTAFVAHPLEWGPEVGAEQPEPGEFDLVAADFLDPASQVAA